MAARGLRSVLQPVLYVGIAAILHGLLFIIPGGGPARQGNATTRGIRVKSYVEEPRPLEPAPGPYRRITPTEPTTARADNTVGPGPVREPLGDGRPAGGGTGDQGGPYGVPGPSQGPVVGSGGPQTEYGQYLAHLRSQDVQGWAQQSAKASRQGWKGSAPGTGGWGSGTSSGSGTGSGLGSGKGTGTGAGGGATAYMDPRVRMVIIQYPFGEGVQSGTSKGKNIESRFRPVPYPDVKVKKARYTSGWWNVYIELWTTKEGKLAKYNVLRPETDGPLERVFVDQVTREMERWTFDPETSEIHVDVRFYVE